VTADRDRLGRVVRDTWVKWAAQQPDVAEHPAWLVGWDDLPGRDREVDRLIGEAVAQAEREQLADLLDEHRDTIVRFISGTERYVEDKERLVGLIAYILRACPPAEAARDYVMRQVSAGPDTAPAGR
jgi:hypothetical protein